jgi:PhnB protein
VYVADVDAVTARAAAAGATVKSPPENKFYGDRMASLLDPFGHTWHIATHVEDVTAEEIQRRMAAMAKPG